MFSKHCFSELCFAIWLLMTCLAALPDKLSSGPPRWDPYPDSRRHWTRKYTLNWPLRTVFLCGVYFDIWFAFNMLTVMGSLGSLANTKVPLLKMTYYLKFLFGVVNDSMIIKDVFSLNIESAARAAEYRKRFK